MDGVGRRHLREHDGAVVLGQEEWRRDARRGERLLEGRHRPQAEGLQRGVEQRDVLALEKPDAAEGVRERHPRPRDHVADDVCRLLLAHGRQRREQGGDADRGDAGVADARGGLADRGAIEGHQLAPVIFVAARHHDRQRIDRVAQVVRPVHRRRQGAGRRQRDADRPDAFEPGALDHRVGEVRRADHHGVDPRERDRRPEVADDGAHPRHHVGGGRRLDGAEDPGAVDQHGIRVGAADVDADALHDEKTEVKSMS